MAEKKKVISFSNLPTGFRLSLYALVYLYIDRFNISGIYLGIILSCTGIIFIFQVIAFFCQEHVNIFKKDEKNWTKKGGSNE
jgi:hypothetical protein